MSLFLSREATKQVWQNGDGLQQAVCKKGNQCVTIVPVVGNLLGRNLATHVAEDVEQAEKALAEKKLNAVICWSPFDPTKGFAKKTLSLFEWRIRPKMMRFAQAIPPNPRGFEMVDPLAEMKVDEPRLYKMLVFVSNWTLLKLLINPRWVIEHELSRFIEKGTVMKPSFFQLDLERFIRALFVQKILEHLPENSDTPVNIRVYLILNYAGKVAVSLATDHGFNINTEAWR